MTLRAPVPFDWAGALSGRPCVCLRLWALAFTIVRPLSQFICSARACARVLARLPARCSPVCRCARPSVRLLGGLRIGPLRLRVLSSRGRKKKKQKKDIGFSRPQTQNLDKKGGRFFNPNTGTTNGAPTVVLHSLSPFLGPENDPLFEHESGHRFRNQVVSLISNFPVRARARNSCTMCARLCSLSSPMAS